MTTPTLFGTAEELRDWRTALEAILGSDLSHCSLPEMLATVKARQAVLAPLRADDIAAAMESDMLDEMLVMATGSPAGTAH